MATNAPLIAHLIHTPVVKSSSRELCYIILAGIFLGYVCPFTLIAKPTTTSCYLQRLLVGLSSAMCYSALVTKTNRIARILAGSKKKICTRKPRFMSAWAQVIIASILISVQLTLVVTLIIMEPPMPILSYPSIKEVYLICNTSNLGVVAPVGYNGLLIMSCTYYAFKTRNVPANFNEAKYIAFTMYTTPPLPPHLSAEETPLFLADSVIPKGLPPPLPQQQQQPPPQPPPQQPKSLMDQLQGVVTNFGSGIPDFHAVLAGPGTPGNGLRSLYPPPPPPQHLQMLPLQLSTFREEPISPPGEDDDDDSSERFKLLQEFVYEREGNTEEDDLEEEEDLPAASKLTPEDSPALTPPSPFRDSVASGSSVPSSPVSESVLCTPPNVTYASVILRDYKQSSSTL